MATQLRVATFNVRNGRAFDGWNSWPFRRPATTAAIAGLEADVVGLQEVLRFQVSALRARLPRYGFVGSGRDDGRRGDHVSFSTGLCSPRRPSSRPDPTNP